MSTDNIYGNCNGPDSQYIVLLSSDEHEFYIKSETALLAETIKDMLTGPGQVQTTERNEIHLKQFASRIIRRICQFLAYKKRYDNWPHLPEFKMTPEILCEILMAADFLDC